MQAKKFLSAMAVAVAGLGAANAAVFEDFKVDPASLGGNPGGLQSPFTADKITGGYNERITFDGLGGFSVSLYWNAGQFFANDGALGLPGGGASGTGLNNEYGLYAVQTASGTVTPTATGAIFTITSGAVQLWYDDDLDTTFAFAGAGGTAVSLGNVTDDFKLADASIIAPSGGVLDASLATCINGINCGSFGQKTTVALTTPDGTDFFVFPVPFYQFSFQSGQLNSFELVDTQDINGSLDLVFVAVPEPTSLALVGLGLFGAGLARRRRVG